MPYSPPNAENHGTRRQRRNTRLKLEGTVSGRWVLELQICCQVALAQGMSLALGLKDVPCIDCKGAALLRTLTQQGIEMQLSSFAAEQLKEPRDVEPDECV